MVLIIKQAIDYTSLTELYLFQSPKELPDSQNVVIKQEFPVKEEKPDVVDTSKVPVLESSSISNVDSKEAKKTSHHSDTSDISGDEGKETTEEVQTSNVINPKHDTQTAEKCVTTLESVQTSKDNNGNLKQDRQQADSCTATMESVQIVKENDENIKHDMQPPETFVATTESLTVQISQTYGDNLKHDTQTEGNCEATTKSVQCSKETDEHLEANTQTCNGATVPVKVSEENGKPPKDNQELSSQEKIHSSSDLDKASESEGSELELSILISDDDIELLEDMNDIDRLKLYDALNKIKNFGYQPKLGQTIVDIVINSVALMRSLKL